MCHVMMGTLVMFRKDSVLNILSEEHSSAAGTALSSGCPHDLYPVLMFCSLFSHPAPCVSTVQSLDWETFEQYSTWQLFLAHSIPLETIIPILQHLKYKGEVHNHLQNMV